MELVRRVADLEAALSLALQRLSDFEPPDSRAISDEFVAMAAVHAGGDTQNEMCMTLIYRELEDREKFPERFENINHRVAPQLVVTYGDDSVVRTIPYDEVSCRHRHRND